MYNCSRINANGSSCFGELNDCEDCYPCDTSVGVGEQCPPVEDFTNGGIHIAKTRGVPSQGSTTHGARGQSQAFSNYGGATLSPGVWMNRDEAIGAEMRARRANPVQGDLLHRTADPEIPAGHMNFRYGMTAGPRQNYERMGNFSGPDIAKVGMGQYVLGLASVGVLFFVIGYSLERGKDIA